MLPPHCKVLVPRATMDRAQTLPTRRPWANANEGFAGSLLQFKTFRICRTQRLLAQLRLSLCIRLSLGLVVDEFTLNLYSVVDAVIVW